MSKKIFRTRVGRNREQTIKVYSLFLVTLRQNYENGVQENLKSLCQRLHISSSISPNDFPKDLYTAPYEKVASLDYAKSWFYSYLQPLRKERRIACKKTDIAPDGLFAEEAQPQPSLADVLAEIERATKTFIENMEAEISKAKSLINN